MATIKYKDENGWQEIAIGGGTGSGLETRILYVPELTAGSELTDDEKAYNVETCQKLIAGTARAKISSDVFAAYSENIIDMTFVGESGIIVFFGQPDICALGGFWVASDGGILYSMPSISSPIICNSETDPIGVMLVGLLQVYISPSNFPSFCIQDGFFYYPATQIMFQGDGGFTVSAQTDDLILTYAYQGGEGGIITEVHSYHKLILGKTGAHSTNAKWMNSRFTQKHLIPTLYFLNEGIDYVPIQIKRYDLTTGHADFVIYRNGLFETWRMLDDGSSTIITE